MKTRFYTSSQKTWRAMLDAIKRAKKSIYLEMYIFDDRTHSFDFVEALSARAAEGITVHVIVDAVGSINLSHEALERLKHAGVEVLTYSYWFHRTHRKLLVVDERLAFVGGVNIAERFALWNDLVVRVHGPVVRSIVRSFARAYVACGGTAEQLVTHAQQTPFARTRTWFVEHGLAGRRFVLRKHYEEAIDSASESIMLVTPYFAPAKWLLAALNRACVRGVRVEILLPQQTDINVMNRLNMHYAAVVASRGAQLYFHPTMNHAKAMLVDNRLAVVGSQNIDALSFGRNVEAGIFFESKVAVSEIAAILNTWKDHALPHETVATMVRWYDKLFVALLRLVKPML